MNNILDELAKPGVRRWAVTALAVLSVFADSASYALSMMLDGVLAAAIIYVLWFHAPDGT